MAAIQKERADELGRHIWEDMVEQYGEAILFAELASITARLKELVWQAEYDNPNHPDRIDRILDLCIDGGNYLDFLYQTVMKRTPDPARKTKRSQVDSI